MSKYENLYSISPSRLMAQLEQDITDLRERQSRLDASVSDIKSLADTLLEKKVYSISNAGRRVDKWHYDVRFPNYFLSNVYQLERDDQLFKRWVGPDRRLEFSLMLDRSIQYGLAIRTVDFKTPAVEQEFVLMADDEELPWMSAEEGTYTAIIPEDLRPRSDDGTRISIGPRDIVPEPDASLDDAWTVWFSFSSMSVRTN